jgi:predicted outer membrane lipoprotein
MSDPRRTPHGPEKVPDRQPPPDPTDLTNQRSLQHGAASRWLVPSAVLAVVAVVLYVLAFQLQLILPLIGILFAVGMWLAMLLVSRRPGDIRAQNRTLAWLMGALAAGVFAILVAIYVVEVTTDLVR